LILVVLLFVNLIGIVSALTIRDVATSPSQVEPGKKIKIILEIKNNLDDDIKGVEISLDLNQVPFAPETSSEIFIDELDESERKNIEFELVAEADAEAGVYKIPIEIKYTVNEEEKTKTSTISATINSKPNLLLSIEEILIKNQKNKLEIRITNIGLNKAKLLEVELSLGNYNILGSNKVYIGDLESDDFDTASFDIFTKSSDTITLPVILKYRDSTNKEFKETEVLIQKVYSVDEAQELGLIEKSNLGFYIGVVIGVVILWIIYRKIRKRRKRKKAEAEVR
jgi:hypothetical protein